MIEPVHRIVCFLQDIGLQVQRGLVPPDAFLPGVRIERGTLVFEVATLRWPGDLLHEAGHLAVTPASRRELLDGSLGEDDPAREVTEVASIAWSWAALVHLDLPAELLFHEEGYRGRAQGLKLSYQWGVYPGAFALAQAGMTLVGDAATSAGIEPFPHMLHWLHPG